MLMSGKKSNFCQSSHSDNRDDSASFYRNMRKADMFVDMSTFLQCRNATLPHCECGSHSFVLKTTVDCVDFPCCPRPGNMIRDEKPERMNRTCCLKLSWFSSLTKRTCGQLFERLLRLPVMSPAFCGLHFFHVKFLPNNEKRNVSKVDSNSPKTFVFARDRSWFTKKRSSLKLSLVPRTSFPPLSWRWENWDEGLHSALPPREQTGSVFTRTRSHPPHPDYQLHTGTRSLSTLLYLGVTWQNRSQGDSSAQVLAKEKKTSSSSVQCMQLFVNKFSQIQSVYSRRFLACICVLNKNLQVSISVHQSSIYLSISRFRLDTKQTEKINVCYNV